MTNKSNNKRGIIKNIIIIFLVVMLLLTFFSNTILNYSLPEVAVQYPMYGTISSRIKGQGIVTANQTYQVFIEETRIIKSVEVTRGSVVRKGDILYRLEDYASDELNTAMNTLATLKINYKRALLEGGYDYSEMQAEIAKLKEDLQEAEYIRDNLSLIRDQLADATITVRDAQRKVDQIELHITQLEQYLASLNPDDMLSGAAFENALAAALEQYDTAKQLLDEEKDNLKILQRELLDLANPLLTAQYKLATAIEQKNAYTAENGSTSPVSSNSIASQQRAIDSAQVALDRDKADYLAKKNAGTLETTPEMIALKRSIEDQETALNQMKSDFSSDLYVFFNWLPIKEQIALYDTQISKLTAELAVIQKDTDDVNTAISQSQNRIAVLQNNFDDAEAVYLPLRDRVEYQKTIDEISSEGRNLTIANEQLSDAKTEYDAIAAKSITESEAHAKISELTISIQTKENALNKKILEDELDQQINDINLSNMKREITQQEAVVARLQANAVDAVIVAPVNGTITDLKYVAGEKTGSGSVMAEIELTDKGYTLSITVTKEQSRRIRVGQEAEIQYYYGSTAPTARVVAIQTDQNNPQNSKIVVLEITGDEIYSGYTLRVLLGDSGNEYDAIVPNSAVHEDNSGKFVFIVESKNTPFGNRYIARKMQIEVIESDDTSSAISGITAYSYYVITTSSNPITSGMQVKLTESN
jgi:multidrug resistance efflux pump